jgi:hypothetical protein
MAASRRLLSGRRDSWRRVGGGVFRQLKLQAEQEANVTIIEKWSEANDYREYFIVRQHALACASRLAAVAVATTAAVRVFGCSHPSEQRALVRPCVLSFDHRPHGGPRAMSDALRMPVSDSRARARVAAHRL